MSSKNKIIVILGPTASGKSSLAVFIARLINKRKEKLSVSGAEIVSADSRQVYKGMDVGTGKVTKKEMGGIPHHMLDVVSPKYTYSVSRYQKEAGRVIKQLFKKNTVAIVCGGTGFYIDSLINGAVLPEVPPNKQLRKILSEKTTEELFKILRKKDRDRAKNIDGKNPARLIRAIEIAEALGRIPEVIKKPINADVLFIGILTDKNELSQKIKNRLQKRMRVGMLDEAKKLHENGLSWKKMDSFGLEYRFLGRLIRGEISKQVFFEKLSKEIEKYAKRQTTWFKKNKKIQWIKNQKEAESLVRTFLSKSD